MTATSLDGRVNRRSLLRGLSLGAMITVATVAVRTPAWAKPASKRPNLLVIMVDDMGFSDLGAYGGDVDTPNLDALAKRSVRFSNFYNMSRCCPSRASLLTGRYPHRVNMTGNGTSLSLDIPTVAEELRDAGYATTMVGKWHLTAAEPLPDKDEHLKWINHQGYFDRDFGDKRTYPAARGFGYHWGIIWGVVDYRDPFSLVENFEPVKSVPKDFYLTDAISDHAVGQVKALGGGAKPFMMYLAYTAPHWPLMAPEPVIQKYLPRFKDGWDAMRDRRYARQVKAGLFDPKTHPKPPVEQRKNGAPIEWSALTAEQRDIQIRKMATHAAMIEVVDTGVGRVMKALKDSGAYDNTAIMFLSDNGASPEIPGNPGYDRPSATRDGRPVAYGEYAPGVGTETANAGIGPRWASAVNTPWRYWKAESYQGGTHTPFLISWPAQMGKRAGTAVEDAAHVIDVTPTLLDLAGVTPRPARAPIDGKSLAGALTGKAMAAARPLFFEHYGARAVIDGRWKIVSLAPGPRRPTYLPWSLYDLSVDATETTDLAAAQPQQVARLEVLWLDWAKSVGLKLRNGAAAEVEG